VGRIAEGHLANLVLWDLNHPTTWPAPEPLRSLAMSDATPAIQQVMIRGKWMGERGNFANSIVQSEAYQAARIEADARLKALLARARA
jgi:cytosine/adenosine deaminase-related metal-dependent hydrolase